MSEHNGHERWSEELAAYLLGALDPAEAAAFEQHAEGCERCRAEARWLAPAMQALPESVERAEPAPELRQRLMAEVLADVAGVEEGDTEERRGWRQRLTGAWSRLGDGPLGLRPLAGVAALALVVAAVAGYLVGSDGAAEPSQQGGAQETIVAGEAPGVVAEMVSEGEGGSLHLSNVEQLPPGKVLEAWVQRDGEVAPAPPLFEPDDRGQATTTFADIDGVEAVMVTVEPAGGSEAPTSEPILTMAMPE